MKKLKIFEAAENKAHHYCRLLDFFPAGLKKDSNEYISNVYVDENGREIFATLLGNGKIGLISLISDHKYNGERDDSLIKKFFDDLVQEM
jgi:hypothetical protein